MHKVPDRAKMRREYLLQKIRFTILKESVAFIGTFAILGGVIAIKLLDPLRYLPVNLRGVGVGLLFGILALIGVAAIRFLGIVSEKADSIEYVPPVRTQTKVLPADEVLLRGSQASPASSEELLRPVAGQKTPAE